MGKVIDMTGWKMWEHGVPDSRWEVIKRAPDKIEPSGRHRVMWECKCQCGDTIFTIDANTLRSGKSKSCGCYSKDLNSQQNSTHHKSTERIYKTWIHMKARCNNPNIENYKDYGGRGIKVCDEWINSFETFYTWATENGYQDNLTIERKDVNGDYCPQNCKWATQREQANNRRTNVFIIRDGITLTLKQWCEKLDANYKIVHERIKRGWSVEDAIKYKQNRRSRIGNKVKCENNTFNSVHECAMFYNIKDRTMHSWLSGERTMPQKWKNKGLTYYKEE